MHVPEDDPLSFDQVRLRPDPYEHCRDGIVTVHESALLDYLADDNLLPVDGKADPQSHGDDDQHAARPIHQRRGMRIMERRASSAIGSGTSVAMRTVYT